MPAKNALKTYNENSYYHLYNRGVNKGLIFLDDQDYKTFLSYLKFYLSPVNLRGESLKLPPTRQLKNYHDKIRLLAYCLIPNHFHLIVWQKSFDGINFFMRSLATKYVRYFNSKYKRIGPVFQGVYKAVLVEGEEQLIYLSKYIHRNPLEILPTRTLLVDYKYSSYGNYLGMFNQAWIYKDDILGLFSQTDPRNSYEAFVAKTDERDLPTIKSVVLEEV
ncbi:MAG: transposase [Patescibacteria group bacterium]|nr:transposase [Candidatus Beckwithbacteria bacterium]MDZ4228855.1 transposase [Patescibacteria group bacterium]